MILSPDHFLVHADGTYEWTPDRVSSAWRLTLIKTREALIDPRYQKLVLLVGLPGAGKTTWLTGHHEHGVLYVDATFVKRCDRAPFVKLAADLGKPCSVILFTTPFDVCASRNARRSSDRAVPPEKMVELQSRLTTTPPEMSEGFFKILFVTGT